MKPALVHQPSFKETQKRAVVEVLTAGANRGARLMQGSIANFNRTSTRFELAPIYVDPVPERAMTLAREGRSHGLTAVSHEAQIEEVLTSELHNRNTPMVVSIDSPEGIASALTSAPNRPVLVYLLVRMPSQELVGMRIVIRPHEEEVRQTAIRFFRALSRVTARSGAAAVIGPQGRPEHMALEGAYRAWFGSHMQANMTKLVSGTAPENDSFEVTWNGRDTMPLLVRESPHAFRDPSELAHSVVEHPSQPLLRGKDFSVAEIGREGIRLHVVRLRATDGKPALRGSAVVSPDAYRLASAERRQRIQSELAAILAKAAAATLLLTLPVMTTD